MTDSTPTSEPATATLEQPPQPQQVVKIPRAITGHEIEGELVKVRILAMDAPLDGASHSYRFERSDGGQVGLLNFHRGRIEPNICDVNGTTMEAVIQVLIDRLHGFQTGPYPHKQNIICVKRLQEALTALHVRTRERIERGVENLPEA